MTCADIELLRSILLAIDSILKKFLSVATCFPITDEWCGIFDELIMHPQHDIAEAAIRLHDFLYNYVHTIMER